MGDHMAMKSPALAVAQDGVFFDLGTLPGGTTEFFSGGKTAVHEVGHW